MRINKTPWAIPEAPCCSPLCACSRQQSDWQKTCERPIPADSYELFVNKSRAGNSRLRHKPG